MLIRDLFVDAIQSNLIKLLLWTIVASSYLLIKCTVHVAVSFVLVDIMLVVNSDTRCLLLIIVFLFSYSLAILVSIAYLLYLAFCSSSNSIRLVFQFYRYLVQVS